MEIPEQEAVKSSIKLEFLLELKTLLIGHLGKVQSYISKDNLIILSKKHTEFENKEINIGFNIFQLISDTYYRENFHSDILSALLNPNSLHNEGAEFLNSFIVFLNEHSRKSWIRKEDYQNALVEREAARIDISIKDAKSKKAIIIENKINNAPVMERQIPRYVNHLEEEGYEIGLVVYLSLSNHNTPSTHDWTQQERDKILPKLFPVAAYNETPQDLYNGWLTKCEKKAQKIDALFLLRQYNNLITYLGEKNMNKPLMEEFLTNMLEGDNYNTAIALNSMLQDLLNYRRDKIIDTFKNNSLPFTKVYDWKNYAVLDDFFINGAHLAIDVITEQDKYRLQFFDRIFESKKSTSNGVTTLLKEKNLPDHFFEVGDRWERQFKFPSQEKELYDFLNSLKITLKEYSKAALTN